MAVIVFKHIKLILIKTHHDVKSIFLITRGKTGWTKCYTEKLRQS